MSFALVKFLPSGTTIPFIRNRVVAMGVSIALMIGSLAAFGVMGINFGIDFRGGVLADVETALPVEDIRAVADNLGLGESKIQASVAPRCGIVIDSRHRGLPPCEMVIDSKPRGL